ncbi:MAG: tyrosine recombinase [Rikenellaceae bacterium]|nr:tyrosine recombinase [Rikenellaceae bacterium]
MSEQTTETAWQQALDSYREYLRFERGLSANSIEAYLRDAGQLAAFILGSDSPKEPAEVVPADIEAFMAHIYDTGSGDTTQARTLSGVRSFFTYLLHADRIQTLPTELIDSPRIARKLPDTLSYEEIRRMIEGIDLGAPLGHRNRAILEVLYCCGLRVSELVNLRLSDIFAAEGIVRVTGKGNKQRLVPIADTALQQVEFYLEQRRTMPVVADSAEIVFLNQHGRKLTRVMIFTIIRKTAAAAGITKTVSPHTLRHSFATHLLQGGADIRAVQELLGHESILTTEIYTHLEMRDLRGALELHPLAHSGTRKNKSVETDDK